MMGEEGKSLFVKGSEPQRLEYRHFLHDGSRKGNGEWNQSTIAKVDILGYQDQFICQDAQ
jgi:hypothetical protein